MTIEVLKFRAGIDPRVVESVKDWMRTPKRTTTMLLIAVYGDRMTRRRQTRLTPLSGDR